MIYTVIMFFMKKSYLWFMIVVCLFSFAFSQQNAVEQMVNANLDASEFTEKSKNIQDVEINFCDEYGSKSISYDVFLWKKQDICLNIFNGSEQDVVVNLWFVDGMLTNDQWKNRACGNNDDIDSFWQYITWYQSSISLKKDDTKTQYVDLRLPENLVSTWSSIEWCLVYSLSSNKVDGSGSVGFDIVVRKAKFITLNIKKASISDLGYLSLFVLILIILFILLYISKFYKKTSKWK